MFWSFPRPQTSWLEHTLYDERIPDAEFKKRLRMSRNTFWMLVNVCLANISRQQTNFRACLTPEKVLAVGLYRLTHGASYQVCADTFNIGKTTVYEAFMDVVAILNALKNNYIKFPKTNEEKRLIHLKIAQIYQTCLGQLMAPTLQ